MDVLQEVDYEYEHSSIRDLSHAPSLPDEHSHSGRGSPQATRPSFKQMGSAGRGLGAAARVWESVSNMANNSNPELIRSHSHPQQQHASPHPYHPASHHYHDTSSSPMRMKMNFSQNITGRQPSGISSISNLPFDHNTKKDHMDHDDEDLSGSIRDLDHAPSLPQDYSIMTSPQPKQPLPSSTRPRLGSMGRLWTSDHSILTSPSLPESSSKRKVNFAPQASNSATLQAAIPGSSRIRSYSGSQVLSDRKLYIPELDSDQHSAVVAASTSNDRSSSAALPPPPPPPPSSLSECGAMRDRKRTESSIITVEDIDKYGYEYESATPAVVVDMEHSEAWGSETEAANDEEEETAYEDDSTWAGRGPGGSGGGGGGPLPSWIPGLDKIALLLVTFAPCFVLCGFKQRTYRAVLGRLNILLALCTIFPICAACFLVVVMFDPKIVDRNISVQQSPNGYSYDAAMDLSVNIWAITGTQIMLGIMAFVILVATVLTCRVVRDVNLVGAIRYMVSCVSRRDFGRTWKSTPLCNG